VAGDRREGADLPLALALAMGKTIADAAVEAGISERTARRRLSSVKFRRKIHAIRSRMMERTLGQVVDGMSKAATTLLALLDSPSDQVRLAACRTFFESALRLRDQVELAGRLDELESSMDEFKIGRRKSNAR
jgi:hypothetical protein